MIGIEEVSKSQSSTTNSGSMSSSTSSKKKARPAFDGANFDKDGNCVKHKSMQLAEQVKQDGRLLWKEIKMNCPKCAAEHHRSRRVTSLGGAGKQKRGRGVHGTSNPLRNSQKSGRRMDVEFDTPFDDKGRCHHHPRVQMASKKRGGGWKILVQGCPRCIEARYDEEEGSVASRTSSRASSRYSRGGGGGASDYDDASVSSKSTKRSVITRTKAATSSGKFDKNGCCTKHPTVQISKKKLLGGWKEFRTCPKCLDPHYDDMADNASVSSRNSRRSTTSFRSVGSTRSKKSTRSAKSVGNASRKGGRKTDRYGALPFDTEGYCHAHPSVRLAKKKALGGWKVLHDLCPDCAHDASSNAGSTRSGRSRRSGKSGTGRYYDDSGSDTSSYKSGKSSSSRKKKIRVKDMKYSDENGKEGRYSGDVNEDHQPNGEGKMKYKDGSVFTGVWSDGSQVHGKTSKGKSSKGSSSSKSKSSSTGEKDKKSSSSGTKKNTSGGEWARRDGIINDGPSIKKVRKMKWMDYYGDPGEYTGEINSSSMPHGKGSMKYDHGLIQDGMWANGQFVEGSDLEEGGGVVDNATTASGVTTKKSGGKSSSGGGGGQGIVKKSSRSGGGERSSSRKTSSKGGGSSRRLEP